MSLGGVRLSPRDRFGPGTEDEMSRRRLIRLAAWSLAAVVPVYASGDASSARVDTVSAPQTAFPTATLSNPQLEVTVYLPDPKRGFYRSTRFDWSGVIANLRYAGHEYYAPWFTTTEPGVRDFIYRGADIVVGAQSAMTGPAEEFQGALGYAEAEPGGTFVKIGVGVLRKTADTRYSPYDAYDLVDPGSWSVERTGPRSLTFTHTVDDPASGYGYVYTKTVGLADERPDLVLAHTLRNTGRLPIEASQYNHNFLTLDGATTGPGIVITVPFTIETTRPPDPAFAEIQGNQIRYTGVLSGEDRVTFPIQGFGDGAADYDIRVEHRERGAGVRVTADRPIARFPLWSIRSVVSVEPHIDVGVAVDETTSWTLTYTYFTLAP